jgi:ubiquitin C-terminal hydrolase
VPGGMDVVDPAADATSAAVEAPTLPLLPDELKVPASDHFGAGIPDGFIGEYELMGVVTHKGRSADSGHYIGWVRQSPGSDYWWRYDDDVVTEVTTPEILNLKGGGDWHTAYMNFYRYKE